MTQRALILAATLAAMAAGGIWSLEGGDIPVAFAAEKPVLAPKPQVDALAGRKLETAVFAGGCFWGVEAVFSHVKGVHSAVSGYSGGKAKSVSYDSVSTGRTGFAEAVQVTYNPRVVSYGTLMRIFFSVVADPTTLNQQGPDRGTQYRSALFPMSPEQGKAARSYLTQLDRSGLWRSKIVTAVEPYRGFIEAEPYHQDFMKKNPRHPYILRWDRPKLQALKLLYPEWFRSKAAK